MLKTTSEINNSNFYYPKITARTWHGQPIEIGKNKDYIWIKTNSLPMLLEIFVWNLPLTILLAIFLLSGYLIGGVDLLLISLFIFFISCIILGFFSLNHNFDFHWCDFLTRIHSRFGRQETIRFSILSSYDNNKSDSLDHRGFFVEDIMAIGYTEDLDGYMCRIYIIMKNEVAIPIGGRYGIFRTANKNQRREFEKLYYYLGSFFRIPLQIETMSNNIEPKITLAKTKYAFNSTIPIKSCLYITSYQYYASSRRFEKLNIHPMFDKLPISILSVYMIIPIISLFFSGVLFILSLGISLNLFDLADKQKTSDPTGFILITLAVIILIISIFILLFGLVSLFRGSYDFIAYEYWDLLNNGIKKYVNFTQYPQELYNLSSDLEKI